MVSEPSRADRDNGSPTRRRRKARQALVRQVVAENRPVLDRLAAYDRGELDENAQPGAPGPSETATTPSERRP
jgi:hypothetical protein